MKIKKQKNDFDINIDEESFNNKSLYYPKNIQINEDNERNLVTLKIYGEIEEPSEYINELSKLTQLSSKYDILEIILNSPGGNLNTTVDLATIIKDFSYVVTIGKGEVASAAFMLWAMGDIRVVTDYSMYMAHRESYGMFGKTSEHKAIANIFGIVYEEFFNECLGAILTKEEKLIADRGEVWLSYKDLINRDGIISYNDYINPKNPYFTMEYFVTNDGKTIFYNEETGTFRTATITYGSEEISDLTKFFYGINDFKKIPKIEKQKPKKEKPKKEKPKKEKPKKEKPKKEKPKK